MFTILRNIIFQKILGLRTSGPKTYLPLNLYLFGDACLTNLQLIKICLLEVANNLQGALFVSKMSNHLFIYSLSVFMLKTYGTGWLLLSITPSNFNPKKKFGLYVTDLGAFNVKL